MPTLTQCILRKRVEKGELPIKSPPKNVLNYSQNLGEITFPFLYKVGFLLKASVCVVPRRRRRRRRRCI